MKKLSLIETCHQTDLNGLETTVTIPTTDREKTDLNVAATEAEVVSEIENGPMIEDENDLLPDDVVQVGKESIEKINLDGEVTREVLLRGMSGIETGCRRLGMRVGQEDLQGRGRLRNDGRRVLL